MSVEKIRLFHVDVEKRIFDIHNETAFRTDFLPRWRQMASIDLKYGKQNGKIFTLNRQFCSS